MLTGTQAVFTPVDRAALKAAVGTCTQSYTSGAWVFSCTGGCLGENATGYCPTFAANSTDANGNPYGVISDWDTSQVRNMYESKL